jgi:outer membrane protein OmpA-like peptidoglycan-associated protein
MDDFGITFTKTGAGYLASNREGSKGDDDIFEFDMNVVDIIEYIRPAFDIILVDAATGERLSGIVNITQRGSKSNLQVGTTGASFRMSAPGADIEAVVKGYYNIKMIFKASEYKGQIVLTMQPIPPTQPEPVLINIVPIYFDYNKFNIRKDASAELDKLVETLNSNPTLTLEASSHTDCRGSLKYNQQLSENRLKSTLEYLKKRIVNPDRLNGIGLGESKPANPCECDVPETTKCKEDIHQANRRTDFIIVKY